MVVTHSGTAGMCVASHVTEDINAVLVNVPIPSLHSVGKTAANLDRLKNQKHVKRTTVQVI